MNYPDVTGALIDKEGRRSGSGDQKEMDAKDVALYARAPKSIRCFNCGKMGHMAWNCRNPKKDDKKDSANATYTVFDEDNGTW
jgi:Zinc knuckle